MKAWVRISSLRARSCQETDSGLAFMTCGYASLQGRGGTGADDLTRLTSDVAEAVRELAGEIIGLSGPEHARDAAYGELDASTDHHARLLAAARQHVLGGRGPGRVALVQHRQLTCGALGRHQAQRDFSVAQLDQ